MEEVPEDWRRAIVTSIPGKIEQLILDAISKQLEEKKVYQE